MGQCRIQSGSVQDSKWVSAGFKVGQCRIQSGSVQDTKWASAGNKVGQCRTQNFLHGVKKTTKT